MSYSAHPHTHPLHTPTHTPWSYFPANSPHYLLSGRLYMLHAACWALMCVNDASLRRALTAQKQIPSSLVLMGRASVL